ncbi:MAG: class I SAM-dependent methyltransferase [Candidatus Eremiobacteraeota bacterium]|nr:class I SAM-dependent methyltransferase [Candidatus Eremiobacteraeota bacterium]MCW5868727.1 class I SAM-dependent methyltransferase [Candidatus Eremiobacteraeota bacterium]
MRTVSVFDPVQNRQREVSREVCPGQPLPSLPQDAVVTLSTYSEKPADPERTYGYHDTVDPQGQPFQPDLLHQNGVPPNALYLNSQQVIHYSGNSPAVLFCEQLQEGPNPYSIEVLDPSHERNRYIRNAEENYQGDVVRAIAQEVAAKTPEFVRHMDQAVAGTRLAFLQSRYGQRRDLNILEVGPGTTGGVPRTLLQPGNGNLYTAIDLSPEALELGKKVLASDGIEVERMTQMVGDASRHIPVADASQDLVLGYASISTWGSSQEVKTTFTELARILKPGGELLAAGTGLEHASPPAIAHILSLFELVPEREPGQCVDYILRRR